MRIRKFTLCGVAALCLAQVPAHADTQGWYLGLGGGWSTLDTTRVDIGVPFGPGSGKIQFGDNAAVDLTGGYKFYSFPLRLEGEVRYADYDATHLEVDGFRVADLSGDAGVVSFFANALYDIPMSRHFGITLGGGVGAAIFDPDSNDVFGDQIRGSQTVFTWQGIAGLTFALSDRWEIEADYRYQGIEGTDHDFIFAGLTSPIDIHSKSVQSAMLSLRWYLNGPERFEPPPPPMMAPPPPPPPPPAPPAVKTFIVFFDFDRSDLTGQAQQVVASAVDSANRTGAVRILVTGHTDTVGSAAYNQALSERRANAVKSQLITDGIAEGDITTVGKGFDDPLVATGPGVREPQNRRAVIDLGTS
jgi:outer membrane protein OmpA-like peptidoglycan-associated protein/opacity protein-like surface antigen